VGQTQWRKGAVDGDAPFRREPPHDGPGGCSLRS
jgi:hypothetical protein